MGKLNWLGFFSPTEYDWIRQSQIDWFLQESGKSPLFFASLVCRFTDTIVASINPIQRPFTPDTGKDFGSIWGRQKQVTPDVLKLAKPNALMFFHIPLLVNSTLSDDSVF